SGVMSMLSFIDDGVAQHSDAFGLDRDGVARLQPDRWIEPGTGAGRRAGNDDVAGDKGSEGRDIGEELAEAEDHPPGAILLPDLAVDTGGQPDVGDLAFVLERHQPWSERAGGIEVLAL